MAGWFNRIKPDRAGYINSRMSGSKDELERRIEDMEGRGWEVVRKYKAPIGHGSEVGIMGQQRYFADIRKLGREAKEEETK